MTIVESKRYGWVYEMGMVYLNTAANFFRKHFDNRGTLIWSCGCQAASALMPTRVQDLARTRNMNVNTLQKTLADLISVFI